MLESTCAWLVAELLWECCPSLWSQAGNKKRGEQRRRVSTEILMAAQGLKSSQSKQCRRSRQRQQQTAGLRAVWPRSCSPAWPSGSLRRCPLIFPHCLSKESPPGPASGRDGISDSALLGFLDRHGGTFGGEKNTRKRDGCPVLLSLFKYGKPQKHIRRRGWRGERLFSPCQTHRVGGWGSKCAVRASW